MGRLYPKLPDAIDKYVNGVRGRKSQLARAAGVERSAVNRWQDGEDPGVERIHAVALELGVTVAYLAGDTEAAQTQEDLALIRAYHAMPDELRKAVDAMTAPYKSTPLKSV